MQYKDVTIEKIIHAAFFIQWKDLNLYIDPFSNNGAVDLSKYPKADYIFITHEHFDHFDKEFLKHLVGENTVVYGNSIVIEEGREFDIKLCEVGKSYKNKDFEFITTPAYNQNKFRSPGVPFHPKDNNGLGYILNLDGTTIFHMGDTDPLNEHKHIKDIDILFVPISGTYVMDPEEAANVSNELLPKIVIPMHFGTIVGDEGQVVEFRASLNEEIKVEP